MIKMFYVVTLLAAMCPLGATAQTPTPPGPLAAPKSIDVKVISEDDAKAIAEKRVPGKAVDVTIEKKRGANRYVVEVKPAAGGKELDVIIDMVSGKVLAVEK